MIKCLSVLLVSFLFLMTGCAPKVITNISKSYPASVTADKVRLYELGEAVPASAERIGNVSVVDNGVSTKCNYDQVVWLAKQETAKAGGNALALTDHRKPSLLGSSCHQIAGSMLLVSDTVAFRAAPLCLYVSVTVPRYLYSGKVFFQSGDGLLYYGLFTPDQVEGFFFLIQSCYNLQPQFASRDLDGIHGSVLPHCHNCSYAIAISNIPVHNILYLLVRMQYLLRIYRY